MNGRLRFALLFLLAVLPVAAQPAPPAVHPFAPGAVRLLDGPFYEAMERDARYLLTLDPDRLLHGFRATAGLAPRAAAYGGWESMGLDGHTLGHYLSALSRYYAARGDARYRDRVAYLVGELAAVQAANGDGYAGAIPGGRAFWAEVAAGRIRTSPFRLNGVWAPWYTLHKTFAGLLDASRYAGDAQALDVARRLADWAEATTKGLTDAQWQQMLACEHGGMNEVLADLSAVTGEPRYLALSRRFHHAAVLAPLARREARLDGLHANTQVPKVLGVLRQYDLLGDDSLRTVADFFWEQVVSDHTYAIGGNSMNEYFGPPGRLAGRLNARTAETCNTYNMLKLTRHLFTLTPRARYADYYERALYNHILASQEPERGMFTYYVSLQPGHFKTYSTPEGAFWCCVGTGMENHVRYDEAIFFHSGADLYVNLFIPAELTWEEKGVVLRQETRFPETNTTRLAFTADQPVALTLRIRHPAWADGALDVRVNGAPVVAASAPGSYLTLERTWRSGDVVELSLPMRLRVEAMPDDPGRVALLYGPLVLAGALGTDGLPAGGAFTDDDVAFADVPSPPVPVLVGAADRVGDWVRPVEGAPLTFRTVGAGHPRDVTLVPFYRLHHQRYSVYWDLVEP